MLLINRCVVCIDNRCTSSYYYGMAFKIRFDQRKNQLLKATRGVGFDEVIEAVQQGRLKAVMKNKSPRFPHQRIYVVEIGDYVYAVPVVINKSKKEIFLKTVYPSRVLTKKYINKSEKKE